jgi:hypothetical protein
MIFRNKSMKSVKKTIEYDPSPKKHDQQNFDNTQKNY